MIKEKLYVNQFVDKKFKPKSRNNLLIAEDYHIINYYNSIAHGFLSYYRCCDNFTSVKDLVQYQLKYSLISTLKNKHKMGSRKQVILKYGTDIKVEVSDKQINFIDAISTRKLKKEFLISPKKDPFKKLDRIYASFSSTKIFSGNCAVLGCINADIEIHHIKSLNRQFDKKTNNIIITNGKTKKLSGIEAYQSALNRKQLPLCKKHHLEFHKGLIEIKDINPKFL